MMKIPYFLPDANLTWKRSSGWLRGRRRAPFRAGRGHVGRTGVRSVRYFPAACTPRKGGTRSGALASVHSYQRIRNTLDSCHFVTFAK